MAFIIADRVQETTTTSGTGTITLNGAVPGFQSFQNIGTGNTVTTNYPAAPSVAPVQSQQINENLPGRVFYVATDQSGNFTVGQYFSVNQATGSATLNASSFNLSGLSSLRLGSIGAQLGAQINEFSTDVTMSQNSNVKVPTQSAVVSYVSTNMNRARAMAYFMSGV